MFALLGVICAVFTLIGVLILFDPPNQQVISVHAYINMAAMTSRVTIFFASKKKQNGGQNMASGFEISVYCLNRQENSPQNTNKATKIE
jgi:hypothetical protein